MQGVEIAILKTFLDDRGYLFEMIKADAGICRDVIKQVTVSMVFPGVIKAFHKHKKQTDWVCCIAGNVKLVVSKGKETQSFYLGEKNLLLVKISSGIWHGYKAIEGKSATIVYCTNQEYNPEDEFRSGWDMLGKEIWEIEHK